MTDRDEAIVPHNRKKVCYYFDEEIGCFHYGPGHPMKPMRTLMTHDLLQSFGILDKVTSLKPTLYDPKELTRFHADEFVNFLQVVSTGNIENFRDSCRRYNLGEDCPVFDGLWEYCLSYAGGSIAVAREVGQGNYDYGVNWSGGMHHGKKQEASGFCYMNDCVLACLELLRYHHRVLYIDIDVHHGDGVEEAFYSTPRVMTLSFHKFGDYFPGTGHLDDIGVGEGLGYSVNVPLQDGLDDQSFTCVFQAVIEDVFKYFSPQAVVLQSGADSLSGDRLGCFNLTLKGHAFAVELLKKFSVPLVLLGGGGYTLRNVPKCWATETATLLDMELPSSISLETGFRSYYAPDYQMLVRSSNMQNVNSKPSMNQIVDNVRTHLQTYVRPVGAHISSVLQCDTGEPLTAVVKTSV